MGDTPKIRFKGFTDDWERRKLGDLCSFINGDRSSNYPNATDFKVRGIPFVGSDSLGMTYVSKNKLRFITSEKYFQMNGLKIQKGDILYTLRGAGFGKCSISDFSEGTVASSLVGLRCSEELLKPQFFIQWLHSANAENEKKKVVNGSTAQNISIDDMKSYVVCTPTIEEQEKISEYLLNLDNLITLHQRKCDETKELKKYMLQKMFPQNGETIPKIRFSGFTGDWEQRKLSEVADKVTEKNLDFAVQETFTNSAEFGVISQRDFFDHDISNADNIGGYYVVRDEDFVYNPRISVTAPVGPVNRNKLGRSGVMSPLYTVFRTHDVDTTYLEWFFKSSYWHPFMFFNGDSGARSDRFSIKDAVFFEMPIPLPSIGEQMKIGAYMDKIDNLITLQQRKCDELKEVKKFMLQNMFV